MARFPLICVSVGLSVAGCHQPTANSAHGTPGTRVQSTANVSTSADKGCDAFHPIGKYYRLSGSSFALALDSDGAWAFTAYGKRGLTQDSHGRYEVRDGFVVLNDPQFNGTQLGNVPSRLAVVCWGERLVLVPESGLDSLVACINEGAVPCLTPDCTYYFQRTGDEDKPLEGVPTLPPGWDGRITRKAVIARVSYRGPLEHGLEHYVLDGGKDRGLEVGMILVGRMKRTPNWGVFSLRIIEVLDDSAIAELEWGESPDVEDWTIALVRAVSEPGSKR
jgi:hypothetical protein